MQLVIDQGNTNIKIYFFSDNKIKKKITFPINQIDFSFINEKKWEKVIYSSVSGFTSDILRLKKSAEFIEFSAKTPLPIKNKYKSKSIGLDRLAGVVGATVLFPDTNILIVDAGSAVTYDFINKKKEFIGGNISPGLSMRFRALNEFTANLPLISADSQTTFLGQTTDCAIRNGVVNGLCYEIEAYIDKIKADFNNIKIIFTGGDANFFAKKIKKTIFAEPNLIAIGLNEILNYNSE